MLKTKVKASSVTNLTDARYFAAMGIEWLGFNFDAGDENHIQPQVMKAIKEWVDGVKIVGEFNLAHPAEVQTAVNMLELDAVQVGMYTEPDTLMELELDIPLIKEIVVERETTEDSLTDHLARYAPLVQAYLLNFDKNGISWEDLQSGAPFSPEFLQAVCEDYQIIISLDLHAGQVEEVLAALPVFGLNLQGGEEERVGLKSFDELDEIFDRLMF